MKRILHFIYGKRYNAVLMISATTALGWALFLTINPISPSAPIYLGFQYLGKPQWMALAYIISAYQFFTMFTHKNIFKKIAFTLGAFLWGFTATDVLISSALWVAVINYTGLTLACLFGALDIAFEEREKRDGLNKRWWVSDTDRGAGCFLHSIRWRIGQDHLCDQV